MALPTCPRCQSNAHVLMVQTAAGDSAIPAELRSAIAAPPPPVRPPGQIGCMSLIITTVLALLISMAAALVAEYTALLSGIPRTVEESAAGLRQDSAFSGIVVFMFGFVAIFSVFVYRHFRSSTIFSLTAERWRRARKNWEQLAFCTTCSGVIAPEDRWFPADYVKSYLQEQRPAQPPVDGVSP